MESTEKVLQYECGFEACGEDEDGLVAEVQRHALGAHGMALTPEQALLLAFRIGSLDAGLPSLTSANRGGRQ